MSYVVAFRQEDVSVFGWRSGGIPLRPGSGCAGLAVRAIAWDIRYRGLPFGRMLLRNTLGPGQFKQAVTAPVTYLIGGRLA